MFLLAFTGNPTPARMRWMVRYCYIFCFMAMITAIVPFFWLDASIGKGQSGQRKVSDGTSVVEDLQMMLNRYLMGNKAIGVVVGCHNSADGQPRQPYVDCDSAGFQWIVHIGGTLYKLPSTDGKDDLRLYAERDLPAYTAGADTRSGFQYAVLPPSVPAPVAQFPAQRPLMKAGILDNDAQTEQKRYYVQGGIIFPLYLIVISLIGGAVGLTRRVPKMQCHLWEKLETSSMETYYKVRQDLVQQMMQFVSAPFVAIVAFSILEPASVAMAAGGAFLSGFASEYILLSISNLFDKLKPEAAGKSA